MSIQLRLFYHVLCFEHSGDSNEFYTQFLSHTDECCKDETRVCGYNFDMFAEITDTKSLKEFVICLQDSTAIQVQFGNYHLFHFVAFFHVASLFSTGVDNKKVGVDNEKVLELTNSTVFHRGRQ